MNNIFSGYDIFFVDLFGVLWDGVTWIDGALDTLEELVISGKTVVILSNAAFATNDDVVAKYEKLGMLRNKHFHHFVTSGGVFRTMLQTNDAFITDNKKNISYKYGVLGKNVDKLFADTNWEYTKNLEDAEFVYVSIPQLTTAEKDILPKHLQDMLYIGSLGSNENDIGWESTHADPFISKLENILKHKKTLIVANPDNVAFCPIRKSIDSQEIIRKLLIRQGAIGHAYKKIGGKTKFIGKPHTIVYKYALEAVAKTSPIHGKKIIMIGDSLETDILGAITATNNLNLQIDSVLVLSGVSANDMNFDKTNKSLLQEFFSQQNVSPTHVMDDIKINSAVRL